MVKLAAILLWAGCFTLTLADGSDFDLADALDTVTKKPPITKKPAAGGGSKPKLYPDLGPYSDGHGNDGLDLGDALDSGHDSHWKPQPNPRPPPRPGSHSNSGDFSDFDLNDGKPLPPRQPGGGEYISDQNDNTVDASTTAQITSPVVAVVVLLAVGTLAGYNAYKQKKFCFKPRGGEEVV